jgi:hypothetical protein
MNQNQAYNKLRHDALEQAKFEFWSSEKASQMQAEYSTKMQHIYDKYE